jgi:ankyrin repeat protein
MLHARRDAQILWRQCSNLYQLVQSIAAAIETRKQSGHGKPLPNHIIQIVDNALQASNDTLEELKRICYDLANRRDTTLTSRITGPVKFTLSSKSTKRFEQQLQTNIMTVSIVLELIRGGDLARIVEEFEQTKVEAVKYLTPSTFEQGHAIDDSRNPGYRDQDQSDELKALSVEYKCASWLATLRSLDDCIDVARSEIVGCSTTSLTSRDSSTNGHDNSRDRDAPSLPSRPFAPRAYEEKIIAYMLDDGFQPSKPNLECTSKRARAGWNPFEWERSKLLELAEYNYRAGNISAAESDYTKFLGHNEALERGGIASADTTSLCKRLACLFLLNNKLQEAKKLTRALLGSNDTSTIDKARLYLFLAEISYANYKKTNFADAASAERELESAWEQARYKSFETFSRLRDEKTIDETNDDLLTCVDFIIGVMEERGDEIEAIAWREQFQRIHYTNNNVTDMPADQDQYKLTEAIINHSGDRFKELLDSGVDTNETDTKGFTPLMRTALSHHGSSCSECLKYMRMLIARGANLDKDNGGDAALHMAVRSNNVQAVKQLLDKGANVDACSPNTALLIAVRQDDAAMVDLLLMFQASVTTVDENHWTPVHHALDKNCKSALLVLLRYKKNHGVNLDIEARCEMDWTPLMHLAEKAHWPKNVELAKALLDHGADVNTIDMNGYPALYYAVTKGGASHERNQFVRLLLDRGADVEFVRTMVPKRVTLFPDFPGRRRDSAILNMNTVQPSGYRRNSRGSGLRNIFGR